MYRFKGLPTLVNSQVRFATQTPSTSGRESGRVRKTAPRGNRQLGFTMLELVVCATVILVVASIALPSVMRLMRSYRAQSSARLLAGQLALAKMRAAESFTQAELNCIAASNSCQLQLCTTKGVGTCTAFTNEGGPIALAQGVTLSYGSVSTPAGTQSPIANTSSILFNSRGIPITAAGVPTANDAIYLTDQFGGTYAVTVYATGKVSVWVYSGSTWRAL